MRIRWKASAWPFYLSQGNRRLITFYIGRGYSSYGSGYLSYAKVG